MALDRTVWLHESTSPAYFSQHPVRCPRRNAPATLIKEPTSRKLTACSSSRLRIKASGPLHCCSQRIPHLSYPPQHFIPTLAHAFLPPLTTYGYPAIHSSTMSGSPYILDESSYANLKGKVIVISGTVFLSHSSIFPQPLHNLRRIEPSSKPPPHQREGEKKNRPRTPTFLQPQPFRSLNAPKKIHPSPH